MKKNIIYISTAIIFVGIIIAFFVFKYVNKPTSTYEDEPAAYSISAKDLFNEYRSDKEAADKKYPGQVIEISGKFKSIEEADSLIIVVFALAEGMFGDEGIRCTMLKKYDEKAKLLVGNSEIKLKGYCTGYNETDIIIEKCIIAE